jgi:hypothetical protein
MAITRRSWEVIGDNSLAFGKMATVGHNRAVLFNNLQGKAQTDADGQFKVSS